MITDHERRRGRPRRFDPDAAVGIAAALFHDRGYDGVTVADVAGAIGINPPSFYAAFESKLGLFERVLERYAECGAIPLLEILQPDQPVDEGLSRLLEEAARRYGASPAAAGCMVVEGMRCGDAEAREAAVSYNRTAEAAIHSFVAARHPEEADRLTDFVTTTMFGLSAKARAGHDVDRLLASARMAGSTIARFLDG